MVWKFKDGDWIAEGENGDFLVWKIRRGFYKARYRTKNKRYTFFLGGGSLSDVKKRCEENSYWE